MPEIIESRRIEKDYINTLPLFNFEKPIRVLRNERQAVSAIKKLMGCSCVGFDTESKPAFQKGMKHELTVLQLASNDEAFIFQLKKTGFPKILTDFFAAEGIKKIGIGIRDDIAELKKMRRFNHSGFVDLSKLAAEKGLIQTGARALVARYMGLRLSKSAQVTNWAKDVLSPKQLKYAAADAWICLQIYPKLIEDSTDYFQFEEEEEQVH